jgi:hypothetical protein
MKRVLMYGMLELGDEEIPRSDLWGVGCGSRRTPGAARSDIVSMAHALFLLLRCRACIDEGCDAAFHDRTRFYGLCSLYIFLAGAIAGLLARTSYVGENTRELKRIGCRSGSPIACP